MKKMTLTVLIGLGLAACAPAATRDTTLTMQPTTVTVTQQVPADAATTTPAVTKVTETTTVTTPAPATTPPAASTPAPASAATTATATTATVTQTPAPTTTPAAAGWTTLAPLSASRVTTFTAAQQVIDPAKSYRAVLKTSKGDVTVDLNAQAAPLAVNNFVFLALNRFYDGTRFHRVIDGFMAQGGDPQSADLALRSAWGTGGPGYQFANERSSLTFDRAGVLAMANAGPDTNGSQFFITYGPATFLNGGYTIFGQVAQGQDVVDRLTRTMTGNNTDIPGAQADTINSVEIQVRN